MHLVGNMKQVKMRAVFPPFANNSSFLLNQRNKIQESYKIMWHTEVLHQQIFVKDMIGILKRTSYTIANIYKNKYICMLVWFSFLLFST